MKNYLYSLFFSLFVFGTVFLSTGCADDPATIPSFVKIDTIVVDSTDYDSTGSISSKVNFAWVYINDNLQGVYQLPCKFPVIGEGVKNFKIFAGVYEFGNGSTATRYIFYDEWEVNDTLVVEDTLVLQPHVRYRVGLQVPYLQDFDINGSDFVKTSGQGDFQGGYTIGAYEGLSGYMHLGTGETSSCIIESGTAINIPKNLPGYFMELNYKCNTPFYFDIKTSTGYKSIIGFNTKETWNKSYINITNAIDNIPGTDVKLIFTMPRDTTMDDQEVLIDNIKLIYQP
jgi:hypothetical protein